MTPQELVAGRETLIGTALTIFVIAGKGVLDHWRRGRTQRTQKLDLDQRFNEVKAGIQEVRSFCVGPDGDNGFRKDISEIKERVGGLEERERERLQAQADAAAELLRGRS